MGDRQLLSFDPFSRKLVGKLQDNFAPPGDHHTLRAIQRRNRHGVAVGRKCSPHAVLGRQQ